MIVNGAGGSGKSVLINIVVATVRRMFNSNDSIKVAAQTGTAAFNVMGETIHRLTKQKVSKFQYKPHTMSKEVRKALLQRFSHLTVLIIDERSLVSSKLLGTAEQIISETIFGGLTSNHSWGGLPVLILVGDDFQLPSVEEGPFKALTRSNGGEMTINGRRALKECAQHVCELISNKRVKENQKSDKMLLARLRTATEITDDDVKKLLSLHLDEIRRRHGQHVVDDIKAKALYLFFRNSKRIQHNLQMLARTSNESNPVAIIKGKSDGKDGKAIKRHFEGGKEDGNAMEAALLCKGCKVQIEGINFNPIWGLFSRAAGTVEEIIFANGANPNHGQLPLYVVVDIPSYSGPVWDTNNKTVS